MADDTTTEDGRQTAPQGPFTLAQVRVGILIFILGAIIVGGIPLVLL